MRKTLILIAGMLLCLILSGCGGQGDSADADQPRSLQNMTVNAIERETSRDESAGGGDEGGAATVDTDAVRATESAAGTAAADDNVPGTTTGVPEGNITNKTQPDEPKTAAIRKRDIEEIKEYLTQFPDTLQELSEAECYVILHGNEHSGREYLNTFIENVKAENSGELVFVQFTTEGAPVLTYLNYDGEDVYCVEDVSRDGFAGGNGEKYSEKYFDSIWLTANTDAERNIHLSLCALLEGDMVLDLFTTLTDESLAYGLPPWAKPPAP